MRKTSLPPRLLNPGGFGADLCSREWDRRRRLPEEQEFGRFHFFGMSAARGRCDAAVTMICSRSRKRHARSQVR